MVDGYHFSDLEDRYVNVSGDTMTGTLTMSATNKIYFPNDGNYTHYYNGGTSEHFSIGYGRIQGYANIYINADTDGSTNEIILMTAGHGISTTTSHGLKIGYNTLTWLDNTIWHAGNDGSGSGLDADYLDGIDSTLFLKKITVPNNAVNDFNTFENMTLTGRGDPTTGASLLNALWTGAGPAGGYGVLTYLWSGYGTQIAIGYNSNKIYIRNKYYNSGAVWNTTWDSLALSADLNNYYTKSESNGRYLRKDTSDTSVGTIRSTYYGPGFANDVDAGSWAYTRFKSGTNEWHVGTNSSGGYIGAGGAFEIRSVGASYSGISVRYNTSSYGKLVVSVPSGECSIGYYSNGAVRWTVGCSDGSNYGWYQGSGGGWKMTLNTSGYLTATGFCKSGSSDSYVLLGGGGHKALSDFSMAHSHPYLPLSGGTMNSGAQILVATTSKGSSDVYNGGIQLREATFSTTSCTDNMYDAPGITFHWGGWWVHKLNMHSNALYWDNSIIITSSNISTYTPSSSVTVSNSNPGLGKSSTTIATIGGTAITAYVSDSDKVDGLHFWTGAQLPQSPSSDTIYIIV